MKELADLDSPGSGIPAQSPASPNRRVHGHEVAIVLAALAGWVFFLAVGLFVNSGPYRETIGNPKAQLGAIDWTAHWIIAVSAYTFTNIAILTVLASMLGAGGHRLETILAGRPEQRAEPRHPYAAAIVRGFFVYLLALSGLMFLVENVFKAVAISADSYIRLAGVISLLSFLIGFSPDMFARLLKRIASMLEEESGRAK